MSRNINLSLIDPDPNQPRKHFDEAKLKELAQSLSANGLAVPILLRPNGERFIIVHGERRFKAAQLSGWQTIAAEIRDVDATEAGWLSLAENIQRSDLSPIEEAQAYKEHLATGITQEQLGQRIGKDRTYITQKLRLLKLPDEIQQAIDRGELSEGHGRQLLRLEDGSAQVGLCQKAITEAWSVARIKLEVDTIQFSARPKLPEKPAEFVWWVFERNGRIPGHDPYPEEQLPEYFKPPVEIKPIPVSEIREQIYDIRLNRDLDYPQWLAEIFGTLPPIAVYRVDGHYILADGKYRLMAADLLGLKQIDCRIYEGDLRDALGYWAAANSAGGLRLTREDIQRVLNRPKSKAIITLESATAKLETVTNEAREAIEALPDVESSESLEELSNIADVAGHWQNEIAAERIRAMRAMGGFSEDVSRDTLPDEGSE